jgi:hypothetical protein
LHGAYDLHARRLQFSSQQGRRGHSDAVDGATRIR